MTLWENVQSVLAQRGVVGYGVTTADPFPETRSRLSEAVTSGRSAGLAFTFGDPAIATDVRISFPWAHRLLVVATAYLPAAGAPGPVSPGTARIARFAADDHYQPLRETLAAVAAVLAAAGHRSAVVSDDNRLVDRAAAVRAGVGWPGKSTLVLVPGAGPWVLLGTVVTDAELPVSEPMRRSCGTCVACLPACPTGAIVAPGVLDARLCLAAVLQSAGWIPIELRAVVGDRFYGCDDCLEACPPGDRARAAATKQEGRVEVLRLLAMNDATLRAEFPHFYVPRNQGRWLRRNALVVLGNTGGPEAIGVLAGYAGHRDPMLRGHAAWALGRIDDPRGRAVLGRVVAGDAEAAVVAEATAALAGTLTG